MPVEPLIRITKGQPDAAELAALTAVVTALARDPGEPAPARERRAAAWRRPERTPGLCNARSWYRVSL